MPRKYKVLRLSITNTLYRRFTNPNRKFTPRSIRTKYLNMRLDERNRHYYSTTPHSVRCSRIYHIKGSYNIIGKVGKPDGDIRFDFSSHNAELLKVVSNSVSSKDIAGAYIGERNGEYEVVYLFPFKQGDGAFGSNKLATESSYKFYPGVYYSRGVWFWTPTLNTYLNGWLPRSGEYNLPTTDYTDTPNELRYSLESTEIQKRRYFIFIPYTTIETPILQAYLPLSYSVTSDYLTRLDESRCGHFDFDIQWMGRGFNPVFITHNSIIVYTGEYTADDPNQYAGTPDQVKDYVAGLLGLTQYSFRWVILHYPSVEWSDNTKISGLGILPECFLLSESNTSSINQHLDVITITSFSSFTNVRKFEHSRIGLLFITPNDPSYRFRLVGIKINYTPVTRQEQASGGLIATNKFMNRELANIVYSNVVPVNTGFHHLARVNADLLPEFFSDPNNPS